MNWIRSFYTNWAGTQAGLGVTIGVFLMTFVVTGPLWFILIAVGFGTLIVHWYGKSQGW